ncbi:hypothetical protein OG758_45890 [Streptomyces sp. NBC_01474]|uniref:hypothetical protein n=1 Tax=Streptomyces sp. NBC_01474 TaxID=2903880 RepID=UPI002DDC14FA|nr:hypothetical protein [Streptomyces sp. NBC_01474]WSE00861.1 hypothetical protein OG758_45890 [Streptomyces sp. NBC_01474]
MGPSTARGLRPCTDRARGGAAYGSYPVAAGHPEYFLPNEVRRADLAVRQVATSPSGEVLLRVSGS